MAGIIILHLNCSVCAPRSLSAHYRRTEVREHVPPYHLCTSKPISTSYTTVLTSLSLYFDSWLLFLATARV